MTPNEIPQIFNSNGELIRIDPASLDPAMAERYAAIVSAHTANKEAEQALADANAEVKAASAALDNVTDYLNAHWPPQTAFDLWKENFGGGPRETMRRRGLID